MKPLEFLADVLPSAGEGFFCVAGFTKTQKEHVFVRDLQEIKPHIKRWLERKRDVYFALSTFTDKDVGRKAENAEEIKSLFIDMDGYESPKAAAMELFDFLNRTNLDDFGYPHIVESGGGVHCYWPLKNAVDIRTWKPVAEALKRLCKQEGLKIDMTVTADAARVLRVPGTLNFKAKYGEPRPVKFRRAATEKVDIRRFGAVIRAMLKDEFVQDLLPSGLSIDGNRPQRKNAAPSATAAALAGNRVTFFETIWMKTEQGTGCAQLGHYIENAQDDGMEPMWRGMLSLAKVCEDADKYTAKLSQLHPYSPQRMHEKLATIKGPYPCVKFDSENPGICPGCKHWGKITNPLALGNEVAIDNAPKQIAVPLQTHTDADAVTVADEGETQAARTFTRPPAPKGYDYGKNGGIYRTLEVVDQQTGVKDVLQIPVLPYDLYVVDVLRMDDNMLYAHLMAVRPIGNAENPADNTTEYVTIILPQKTAVSKDDLLKVLASHGVLAANGKNNDVALYEYVRGAVTYAVQSRPAVTVPIQFGWQKDRSFVYNNRVFKADGTEVPVPMPGLENINRATSSKGTLAGWREFWNMLIKRKEHTMLAMGLDSFGSTLMHFSEYQGFVWHIGSTESGTGKTLTLNAKAGVWGAPVRYRTGKGTSQVAMQQRAGLLNSLPLLIDEITSKARNDVEWVPEFIFNISEGQGKERMESGANKERVNNTTWALTCTMTSNTHLHDVLTSSRKHSSNGEIMRMLEWTPTQHLRFNSEDERSALMSLTQNYGVAGEAWVRWLVQNYETARKVWNKVHNQLRTAMEFTDEERYWHAACTSTVTAGVLLGSKYAGILEVPLEGVIDALHALVRKARLNFKQTARSAEDVINIFIQDNYGSFVIVRKDGIGKTRAELGEDMTTKHSTRGRIMGRIEMDADKGEAKLFVEERIMRMHCSSMSYGYEDFKRQYTAFVKQKVSQGMAYGAAFGVRKNMLANTDGVAMRVSAAQFSLPLKVLDRDAQDEAVAVA